MCHINQQIDVYTEINYLSLIHVLAIHKYRRYLSDFGISISTTIISGIPHSLIFSNIRGETQVVSICLSYDHYFHLNQYVFLLRHRYYHHHHDLIIIITTACSRSTTSTSNHCFRTIQYFHSPQQKENSTCRKIFPLPSSCIFFIFIDKRIEFGIIFNVITISSS